MMVQRKTGVRRGGIKAILLVSALYVGASVGYYYLPWSIRKHVSDKSPKLDQLLRKSGLSTLEAWDDLGLWGSDCTVPANPAYHGVYAYAGLPTQGFQLFGRVKELENEGYAVGYSESMRNPLWAAYRVFETKQRETGKRPSFRVDTRTSSKVSPDDYTRSGYDRGHLAPNYAIATRYGSDGQRETFLMSNIIPQNPTINRHLWKDLEMRVAKKYGLYFSEVWVITGPVFSAPVKKLDSGVSIPSAYYKIIADENEGRLRVIAFLIDAESLPYTRIKKCLVSIDELEEKTGLNFFPNLSEEDQITLESQPAGRLWPWYIPAFKYHFGGKTQ